MFSPIILNKVALHPIESIMQCLHQTLVLCICAYIFAFLVPSYPPLLSLADATTNQCSYMYPS